MINANNNSTNMNYYWHFYCTDVIYCVLIYYFLIYVFLPSDDFFRPFGDEVYSHKAGDHYRGIRVGKVAYQNMPY